jgi:hypothetical protein
MNDLIKIMVMDEGEVAGTTVMVVVVNEDVIMDVHTVGMTGKIWCKKKRTKSLPPGT